MQPPGRLETSHVLQAPLYDVAHGHLGVREERDLLKVMQSEGVEGVRLECCVRLGLGLGLGLGSGQETAG